MRPAVSFTSYLPLLPLEFIRWWFIEGTINLLKILLYLFRAVVQLLSIPLIFKTFFKPWKNEYRQGLVRFSIFFGIGLKTMLLFFDFFFLSIFLLAEIFVLVFWILLPFLFFWGIYAGITQ